MITENDIIIQKYETLPVRDGGKRIYRAYLIDKDRYGTNAPIASGLNLNDTIELAIIEGNNKYPNFECTKEIPLPYREVMEFYVKRNNGQKGSPCRQTC